MKLIHTGTQTIETDRLILRRFTIDDAEDMYKNWLNDDEVTKYLRFDMYKSVDEIREFLSSILDLYLKENRYSWAIQLINGECIGSFGAFTDDRDLKAEIAYCLGRAYWNNGYLTEAANAVVNYLFNVIGVNRIEAYHSVNNPASGKVMQKIGMIKEGHSKQKYYCRMGFQDCDLYGIIKEDYEKRGKQCF